MATPFSDAALRMASIRLAFTDLEQAPFAESVGMKRAAWNHYEKGRRRIDIDAALRLRETFRVTLDYIYCGSLAGLEHGMVQRLAAAYRRAAEERK